MPTRTPVLRYVVLSRMPCRRRLARRREPGAPIRRRRRRADRSARPARRCPADHALWPVRVRLLRGPRRGRGAARRHARDPDLRGRRVGPVDGDLGGHPDGLSGTRIRHRDRQVRQLPDRLGPRRRGRGLPTPAGRGTLPGHRPRPDRCGQRRRTRHTPLPRRPQLSRRTLPGDRRHHRGRPRDRAARRLSLRGDLAKTGRRVRHRAADRGRAPVPPQARTDLDAPAVLDEHACPDRLISAGIPPAGGDRGGSRGGGRAVPWRHRTLRAAAPMRPTHDPFRRP
jgi:hypothetical protein